jgi:hypothetical protein
MRYPVSKTSIEKTRKCKLNFACLGGGGSCLCPVEDCVEGNIHFIRPPDPDSFCNYLTPFGYSYTCTCPVRKEIYNSYGV